MPLVMVSSFKGGMTDAVNARLQPEGTYYFAGSFRVEVREIPTMLNLPEQPKDERIIVVQGDDIYYFANNVANMQALERWAS